IYVDGPLKHYALGNYLFTGTLFVLATCSASTFFVFAQRELFGGASGWKTLLHLPMLMALGVGISVNNTKAVIEAIISHVKRKPSEFVRTPKYGVTGSTRNAWQPQSVFTFQRLMLPIIEVALGCYMSCFVFISLFYDFARSSIPFLLIFAGGYFYVGCSSLYVLWKMNREAQDVLEAQAASAVEPVSLA
ncbi:MAG TPA: hypothetical protein VK324_07955, partial [Tepidisphaeraceae bacterium]|nr:hypothetical protein [Tepidisphaeraceae bacterium]